MSCFNIDTAMTVHVEKVMNHPFKPLIWKGFCDVIPLWIHSNEDVHYYLNYINIIDASGKIRFTMQTDNEMALDF